MVIEWTGDLEDDCFATLGQYHAHCECLNDHRCYDPEDPDDEWGSETWFVCVSFDTPNGPNRMEYLFNSAEHGGSIGSGEMARAICEAVMQLAYRADMILK